MYNIRDKYMYRPYMQASVFCRFLAMEGGDDGWGKASQLQSIMLLLNTRKVPGGEK